MNSRAPPTNETMSQIEMNKAVIQRYFDAYNNKDEAIFDEIIAPEYVDHGQTFYMGSPGRGVAGAKRDLKYSLDKLDDLNYVVEAMIASDLIFVETLSIMVLHLVSPSINFIFLSIGTFI